MKIMANQYDQMKKMLNTSRKGVLRQRLREDSGTYYNQKKEANRQLSSQEIEQEQSEFAANVTKLSQFREFKITYDNVQWGGFLPQEKIEWVYSLESDDAVFVSCELTQLTEGTLELLQKLYGYYTKWADKWRGEIGVQGTDTGEQTGMGDQGAAAGGQEQAPPPPQI